MIERNASLGVGDAVFYGGLGAEIVQRVEIRDVEGRQVEYLVLEHPDMTVRAPRTAPALSPLEPVMGPNGIADALDILADPTPPRGWANASRFLSECSFKLTGFYPTRGDSAEEEEEEEEQEVPREEVQTGYDYDVRQVALALRLLRDRFARDPKPAFAHLLSKARWMLTSMIALSAARDNAWAADAIEQALARSAPPT